MADKHETSFETYIRYINSCTNFRHVNFCYDLIWHSNFTEVENDRLFKAIDVRVCKFLQAEPSK